MLKVRFIFRKCFYLLFLVVLVVFLVDVVFVLVVFFCVVFLVVVDLVVVCLLVVFVEVFLVVFDDVGVDLVVLVLWVWEVEEVVEDDFVDVFFVVCVDFDEVFLGVVVLLVVFLVLVFLVVFFVVKRVICFISKLIFVFNSLSCCFFCWCFWLFENVEKSGVDVINFWVVLIKVKGLSVCFNLFLILSFFVCIEFMVFCVLLIFWLIMFVVWFNFVDNKFELV